MFSSVLLLVLHSRVYERNPMTTPLVSVDTNSFPLGRGSFFTAAFDILIVARSNTQNGQIATILNTTTRDLGSSITAVQRSV